MYKVYPLLKKSGTPASIRTRNIDLEGRGDIPFTTGAQTPYKAGGEAITPSGAGGKLATNVGAEETAGTISRDKTLVNRLIHILV